MFLKRRVSDPYVSFNQTEWATIPTT